jgi:hypothetical protein
MVFPISILSSNGFSILTLRQASFVKLRAGQTDWKGGFQKPQEIKNCLRALFLSFFLFFVVNVLARERRFNGLSQILFNQPPSTSSG